MIGKRFVQFFLLYAFSSSDVRQQWAKGETLAVYLSFTSFLELEKFKINGKNVALPPQNSLSLSLSLYARL